jgi:hypothetical protein
VFVRTKVIAGKPRYYLCKSVRRDGMPRQVVLAYLGQFDNVEDAYANASGRRRSKLAKYRNPADVINERIEAERYRQQRATLVQASREAIQATLPRLQKPAHKSTPISPAVERWVDEMDAFFEKGGWRK